MIPDGCWKWAALAVRDLSRRAGLQRAADRARSAAPCWRGHDTVARPAGLGRTCGRNSAGPTDLDRVASAASGRACITARWMWRIWAASTRGCWSRSRDRNGAAGPRRAAASWKIVVPADGEPAEIKPGQFFLRAGMGRKATGSFYTPHEFVRFLVRETLDPKIAALSPPDDPQPARLLTLEDRRSRHRQRAFPGGGLPLSGRGAADGVPPLR